MKGSVKRSHAPGTASRTDGETLLCSFSAKGALAERKEAEALDLQQLLLEHSSEKSCQEQLGRNSTTTLTGCAQKVDVEGSSSQGSEPSHRHAWQEKGEQTWGSSIPRCVLQPTPFSLSFSTLSEPYQDMAHPASCSPLILQPLSLTPCPSRHAQP